MRTPTRNVVLGKIELKQSIVRWTHCASCEHVSSIFREPQPYPYRGRHDYLDIAKPTKKKPEKQRGYMQIINRPKRDPSTQNIVLRIRSATIAAALMILNHVVENFLFRAHIETGKSLAVMSALELVQRLQLDILE